jgi:hypothetical protein
VRADALDDRGRAACLIIADRPQEMNMATLPGLPDLDHPEDDPQALPIEPEMTPEIPGVPDEPDVEPAHHDV